VKKGGIMAKKNIDELKEEIKKMISEIIEIPEDKLAEDAELFRDLGADSLKAIEIVAAFEKKYHVIIPERDIPKIKTIKQILSYAKNIK
jgi:acyl carrier protein